MLRIFEVYHDTLAIPIEYWTIIRMIIEGRRNVEPLRASEVPSHPPAVGPLPEQSLGFRGKCGGQGTGKKVDTPQTKAQIQKQLLLKGDRTELRGSVPIWASLKNDSGSSGTRADAASGGSLQ